MPFLLPASPTVAPLKSVIFSSTPKWQYSPHGLPIGIASVYPPEYRVNELDYVRTTPKEACAPMPEPAQTYLHWLFALYDRELSRIDGIYGGSLAMCLDFLTKNWRQLCKDIEHGKITDNSYGIPEEIIKKIEPMLVPDNKRSNEIIREFQHGTNGVCKRIWPRLTMTYTICTGAHEVFKGEIKRIMGDVHIYSSFYVSSECGVAAVNLDHPYIGGDYQPPGDNKEYFTMLPNNGTFYEFWSLDDEKTYLMDELKTGQRYEVVLTSDTCGFYRYRIGDIIEVKGHFNQTPIFEFRARMGSLLDLRGEKTSEDMVFNALKDCVANHWKNATRLIDFTSTDCFQMRKVNKDIESGMFYIIFVEIDGIDQPLTDSEQEEFDLSLRKHAQNNYDMHRRAQNLKQPKVIAVKHGAFEAMKQWSLSRHGAVSNQYKTPKYLKNEEPIEFILKFAF